MVKLTSLFLIFSLFHTLMAAPVVDEMAFNNVSYHIVHTKVPYFAGPKEIKKTKELTDIEHFYTLSPDEPLFFQRTYSNNSLHSFLNCIGQVLPYNNTLASIFNTLKNKPQLLSSSNKALLFHGSNSASLIAFTESAGEDRGKLFPTGVLLQKGKAPFSGELDIGAGHDGINMKAISTVFIDNIDKAIYYAKLKHQDLKNNPIFEWHKDIANKREAFYAHLNEQEQLLIALRFPVVYGFRIALGHSCTSVNSDIRHEIGVLDEVNADEIKVLYVPDNYITTVKTILEEGHFSHIEVSSLDALTSTDAPIPSPWNWH